MCPAFYEFMAAGARRSDSGEILMIGEPRKARRPMTNDENRKIARDTSVILCDVFDRQEMEDVIAMKYAPSMAELERLRRQVEFAKRESLLALRDSRGRHEETKCLLCGNQWYVECSPRHHPDCPHAKEQA
jgi:hypothetical protein